MSTTPPVESSKFPIESSGKEPKKIARTPPSNVGESAKKSTLEKVLRGLSAPISAPLMAVGGFGMALGGAGVLTTLTPGVVMGGSIGKPVGKTNTAPAKGAMYGAIVSGAALSPILLLSSLVGLIGLGLFLGGSLMLAPNLPKNLVDSCKNAIKQYS